MKKNKSKNKKKAQNVSNITLLPDAYFSSYYYISRRIGREITEREFYDGLDYIRFGKEPKMSPQFGQMIKYAVMSAEQFDLSNYALLCLATQWYWNSKHYYKYDPTMTEILLGQVKDVTIDVEALKNLPQKTFYVERAQGDSKGFMFSYIGTTMQIADFVVTEDNKKRVEFHSFDIKNGGKLADILAAEDQYVSEEYVKLKGDTACNADTYNKYFPFILYLTAVNREVVYVGTHRSGKKNADSKPTNVSHVGYTTGAAVRQQTVRYTYTDNDELKEHRKGAKKTPHIRSSHFHPYWEGTGENKHLVVKWINTIFVNSQDGNPRTIIHNIRGKKNDGNERAEQ